MSFGKKCHVDQDFIKVSRFNKKLRIGKCFFFFKADLDLKNDRQALFTQFVKNIFSSHTCTCIHHKFRAMAIDKIFLKISDWAI